MGTWKARCRGGVDAEAGGCWEDVAGGAEGGIQEALSFSKLLVRNCCCCPPHAGLQVPSGPRHRLSHCGGAAGGHQGGEVVCGAAAGEQGAPALLPSSWRARALLFLCFGVVRASLCAM